MGPCCCCCCCSCCWCDKRNAACALSSPLLRAIQHGHGRHRHPHAFVCSRRAPACDKIATADRDPGGDVGLRTGDQ
uniref:Putative secreted protein n=1 Tax=Anopheles marajoara TaxID=58244 RepID=A0A2M4CCV6_9DIPT